MTVLTLDHVSKSYGDFHSVDDVSLELAAGERLALLGHNGAGKTTLMRMVLGLTATTSGTISVLDDAPGGTIARRATGFLPESVAFHGALTGREQLRHFARLKGESTKRADDLLDRVGLGAAATRKMRTYSKGMRQRVGLAQALLGRPKLALLDEPTSGLDPISRHEFYELVAELSTQGCAVLLSSHALTELEAQTDRIAILSKGRLLANDSLPNLRRAAKMPIKLSVRATPEAADTIAAELGGTRINGCSIDLTCAADDKLSLLGQITGYGDRIRDVDVTASSLEDLYRHYSLGKGDPQ